MEPRDKSLKRLIGIQKHMNQLAEWEAARLRLREAEIHDAKVGVLEAFNGDTLLQGVFVEQMARQLRRLEQENMQVMSARNAVQQRALHWAQRQKASEVLLKEALVVVNEERARKEFQAYLESCLQRGSDAGDASFP